MARQKVVKKVKKSRKGPKNQAKAQMNSIDVMEKVFKDAPRQISLLCQKEIAIAKQQEKKLVVALKKALSLTNQIKKKCNVLVNSHMTATTKKRLASAKKGLASANAVVKEMTSKHEHLKMQMKALTDKQHKLMALIKEMNKFEAQWSKDAKNTAALQKTSLKAKQAKASKGAQKSIKPSKKAKQSISVMTENTEEMPEDTNEMSVISHEEHEDVETTDSV